MIAGGFSHILKLSAPHSLAVSAGAALIVAIDASQSRKENLLGLGVGTVAASYGAKTLPAVAAGLATTFIARTPIAKRIGAGSLKLANKVVTVSSAAVGGVIKGTVKTSAYIFSPIVSRTLSVLGAADKTLDTISFRPEGKKQWINALD